VTVDPDDAAPLFEQVAEVIRQQIESGQLQPRRKLVAQDRLAEIYAVSRGTVVRATGLLVTEGVIRWVPGRGLYVADADVIERWKRQREAGRKRKR
jgi:DNA-binding GntR family transcriptional regulator